MPTEKELTERRLAALKRHRRRIYLQQHPLIEKPPQDISMSQKVDGSCALFCTDRAECDLPCFRVGHQ